MTDATQSETQGAREESSPMPFAFYLSPPGATIEYLNSESVKVTRLATEKLCSLYFIQAPTMAEVEAALLAIHLNFAPQQLARALDKSVIN